jgi:L-alanine-DL-glutamate epimerase-like enolase superfamily enzyme
MDNSKLVNSKISDIKTYLIETKQKGNFSDSTRKVETIGYVVVEVITDTGLKGIGVTYHEVGGEAICEFIHKSIGHLLIGSSPLETEALYDEVFAYMRGVGRKGLAFCAYSAIDIALWDIKGKIFNLPVYKLLGGKRVTIPCYASGGWVSYSTEELVAEAKKMVAAGFKTIKIKIGFDGGKNPNEDSKRIHAVAEAIGPDIGIMIDANNAFTSSTALRLAYKLQDLNIIFFEEPVFADDLPGLARFRAANILPCASGEHEYTRFGARDLIVNNCIDFLQSDITRCGGFTEARKMLAIAQAFNISYAPHGFDLIHAHLLSAFSNGVYLESLFMFNELVEKTFTNAPKPVDGNLTIPDRPGLGLTLNYDNLTYYGSVEKRGTNE